MPETSIVWSGFVRMLRRLDWVKRVKEMDMNTLIQALSDDDPAIVAATEKEIERRGLLDLFR